MTLACIRLLKPAIGQKGNQQPLGRQIHNVKCQSGADTDRHLVDSEHGCVYLHCTAVCQTTRQCRGSLWHLRGAIIPYIASLRGNILSVLDWQLMWKRWNIISCCSMSGRYFFDINHLQPYGWSMGAFQYGDVILPPYVVNSLIVWAW